jgi:hypothetical protein
MRGFFFQAVDTRPPEAARAALPPEFELQAFDVPADVMSDDEDQRQDLG